jgi:hypothetical protein
MSDPLSVQLSKWLPSTMAGMVPHTLLFPDARPKPFDFQRLGYPSLGDVDIT